jgi:bifunctional non-homologous end joining protein LigD
VIVSDPTGRPQFYDLLRHKRAPTYVAFDMLWLDGDDLRPLPLSERRRSLETMLPTGSPCDLPAALRGSAEETNSLRSCASTTSRDCREAPHDPYAPRTRWLKIKNLGYSQQEGRDELFNGPPQRPTRSAAWR